MASVVTEWTDVEIRALRKARRMTLDDFSKHLGISVRTIHHWEHGTRNTPVPRNQQILDTSLAVAPPDVRARFWSILNDQLRPPRMAGKPAMVTGVVDGPGEA